MESEREKERTTEREGEKVRRTYDVHLLAFHGRLTRKWKVLQEVSEETMKTNTFVI